MARIVISYRRDDAAAHAGRIYDRLRTEFGPDQVFMDIDAIEPGVDFVDAIEDAIGSADVLIAIIGRRWTTIADEDGTPRIKSPTDFVRLEVAAALKRDIRVIPVLVDGVTMPTVDELPEDLGGLVRRNAIDVSHTRFHADAQRLALSVRKILEQEEDYASSGEPHETTAGADRAPTRPPAEHVRPPVAKPAAGPYAEGRHSRPPWWRPAIIGAAALVVIAGAVAAYLAYGYYTLPPEPDPFSPLAWSPGGERIAFSGRTPTGSDNLYRISVDGSGLLEFQSDAYSPVTWSPDGERISFARGLQYHLLNVMDAQTQVLPGNAVFHGRLNWSSDGAKVAFWTGDLASGPYHLRVMDLAENDLQTVLSTREMESQRDHSVAWSPDAKRIAAVVQAQGQDELLVVDVESGQASRVLGGGQYVIEYPGWSKDGEWLFYSAGKSGTDASQQAVFRVRTDGSEPTRLTDLSLTATGPRISPDGSVIALSAASSQWASAQLYLMDLDGSQLRPVSPDSLPVYAETVAWSPDGRRLAFVTWLDTGRLIGRYRYNIAVIDRDGRDLRLLLH